MSVGAWWRVRSHAASLKLTVLFSDSSDPE